MQASIIPRTMACGSCGWTMFLKLTEKSAECSNPTCAEFGILYALPVDVVELTLWQAPQ